MRHVAALTLALALAAIALAEERASRYVDRLHGFALDAPAFVKAGPGEIAAPVSMTGHLEGVTAPTINVTAMGAAATRDQIRAQTRAELKSGPPLAEKDLTVSGREALLVEYRKPGPPGEPARHFLILHVFGPSTVYTATAAAPDPDWAKCEKKLRAAIESFALTRGEAPKDARDRSHYHDALYGFTLDAPKLDPMPDGKRGMAVGFRAVAVNGFAAHLLVNVDQRATTRDALREELRAVRKKAGMTTISEEDRTVSGHDAVLVHTRQGEGERALHQVMLAVVAKERLYVVIATEVDTRWAMTGKILLKSLDSFEVLEK